MAFVVPSNLGDVRVDGVAPTVSTEAALVREGTYNANDHIDITVTFSEDVSLEENATPPSISLIVGSQSKSAVYDESASSGNNIVFRYIVEAGYNDSDGLGAGSTIANHESIVDGVGNSLSVGSFSPPSNMASVIVDTTSPPTPDTTAPSIVSVTIADGSYSVLPIVVTMSEPVTVDTTNGTPSISVTISGTVRDATYQVPADPSVASATLNFSYTAASSENDDDGIDMGTTLSLNDGVIQDGASNALPDSSSFTKPTNLASIIIDTTVPTVSSVTIADGSYTVLPIVVTMSEPVTVDTTNGVPSISVTISGTARDATYQAPADPSVASATLNFSYTAASNENDDDGIDDMGTTLSLNSGVIKMVQVTHCRIHLHLQNPPI